MLNFLKNVETFVLVFHPVRWLFLGSINKLDQILTCYQSHFFEKSIAHPSATDGKNFLKYY